MTHMLLLTIGSILCFCTLILGAFLLNEYLHTVSHRESALGLPPGRIVYEDTHGDAEALHSTQYPISGKPDYVIEQRNGVPVPVELKLNVEGATAPHSNHVLQLATYFLLLEEYFDVPATHGFIRYADSEFRVDATPALRRKVLHHVEQLSQADEEHMPALEKQRVAKCRACIYQSVCPVGRGK